MSTVADPHVAGASPLLAIELARAIANGDLTAAFQPIVAPFTRAVIAVEVLARWTHEHFGQVPPVVFIAEAERLGLSEQCDTSMLHLACRALARRRAGGLAVVPVQVNVSPQTMRNDGVAARLLEVLRAHDVPERLVCFELTEDTQLCASALHEIALVRSAGCRVSVDDFGTGFSGLGRLQQLAVDQVKLDWSITTGLPLSAAAGAVARAAVALAADLGVELIAEGVETVTQERALQALGVDGMQGYVFARPTASFDEAVAISLPASFSEPPGHAREEERLDALRAYEILDTAPEPVFDTLTALAAEVCGTEIALISLVDETRQWFKSSVGLESCETPRDVSFCAHAILGTGVMHVRDATLDDRFAGNPLVVGAPAIRMYAGAPLISAEGLPIGTLCVIGTAPGDLGSAQIHLLEVLASQVVAQLEARSVSRRLAEALADKHDMEEELRHQATHDDLTGLANRRLFLSRLESAADGSGAGVVFIDLDDFKAVNDHHGHQIGDALLLRTAETLRRVVRSTDLVARIGGDEFAIITVGGVEEAHAVADRVREALCSPVVLANLLLQGSASVGVGYCSPGVSPAEAMVCADRAMYRAKPVSRRSPSGSTVTDAYSTPGG